MKEKKIHYYEVEFEQEYSICIKGVRKPTKKEAAAFCKVDMDRHGLKTVVAVIEWSHEEAVQAFAMEQEHLFPIFGVK